MNQSRDHHAPERMRLTSTNAYSAASPRGPHHFHHTQNPFQAQLSYDEESTLWLIELSSAGKEKRFHGAYRSRAAAELSLQSLLELSLETIHI